LRHPNLTLETDLAILLSLAEAAQILVSRGTIGSAKNFPCGDVRQTEDRSSGSPFHVKQQFCSVFHAEQGYGEIAWLFHVKQGNRVAQPLTIIVHSKSITYPAHRRFHVKQTFSGEFAIIKFKWADIVDDPTIATKKSTNNCQ
jgi:hypothetical protein